MIRLKRVYEKPSRTDGLRILVDRLWPRGLTKQRAAVTLWLKDVAPSTELRKWFGHEVERWPKFQARYHAELAKATSAALLDQLAEQARRGPLTLVFGARDPEHNQAKVIADELERRLGESSS